MLKKTRIVSNTFEYLRTFVLKKKDSYNTFCANIKEYHPICSYPHVNSKKLYLECRYYLHKYGLDAKDYFIYGLYRYNEREAAKYISSRDRSEFYVFADKEDLLHFMSNKKDFFSVYSKYMQKDCIFVDEETTIEEFSVFCTDKDHIIVKPLTAERGEGIQKLPVRSNDEISAAFNICKKGKLIAEKVIKNCKEIAEFHPESLNTIRVSTVIDNNKKVRVMATSIRMGTGGNVVDNGHYNGIFAGIDKDNGEICTLGYNMRGEVFPSHPDTHARFTGFVIPKWDELMKIVQNVTLEIPELRYIGWDFALNENYEWILIEGNEPGGVHILQQPICRGLKDEYKSAIYGN